MTMGNENIFNFKIIDILGTALELRIKNNGMVFVSQSEAGVIDKLKSSRHKLSTPLNIFHLYYNIGDAYFL